MNRYLIVIRHNGILYQKITRHKYASQENALTALPIISWSKTHPHIHNVKVLYTFKIKPKK